MIINDVEFIMLNYTLKASLNRCDFNLLLKMFTFPACLTVAGKEFHNRGAATVKAISPALTDLLLGTLNN